jgi:dipeptidyl aminopeptidase/acylaminoacyl peptidase
MRWPHIVLGCLLAPVCALTQAATPPISTFARRPEINQVHLSQDGRYLLYTTTQDGVAVVVTLDRRGATEPLAVLRTEERIEVTWCRWVTAARFVCALREISSRARPQHPFSRTRLAAVDADGTDARIIFEYNGWQDGLGEQVVNLRSLEEGWIQVQTFRAPLVNLGTVTSDDYLRSEALRVNVRSGTRESIALTSTTMPSFVDLIGDRAGEVLIANGIWRSDRIYWVRFGDQAEWRELFRHDPLDASPQPAPFAVVPGTRNAYAIGPGTRHRALFQIDLSGSAEQQLVFESPDADVREPVFAGDGRVLGVRVDTERPTVHYLNRRDASAITAIDRLLPQHFNEIVDATPDRRIYVIRSSSDVDAGTYYLLDTNSGNGELEKIEAVYPDLNPATLAPMRAVEIKSREGEPIRAFVSIPLGAPEEHLPLIVMPDDGPNGRTEWRFGFLRHFLLSRGYAVLQLQLDETSRARNHSTVRRGLYDVAYSTVEAGVQWAIAQRIADPQRIAIIGWGFGGYLALLGAERNPDLFRCAVGINAVTDLNEQPGNHRVRELIGDPPLVPAKSAAGAPTAERAAPVLLIHGSHDTEVHPHHTRYKAHPLDLKSNTYERIEIESGTHELSDPTTRARMLEEVEKFLAVQLTESE